MRWPKLSSNPIARRRAKARAAAGAFILAAASAAAVFGQQEKAAVPIVLGRKQASRLLLSQVKPDYPPLARVNYIQGRVRMEVTVKRDGHVGDAHVVRGHPFLAASAIKAIRRWVYRPFMTAAGPAPFETDVDVNFALRVTRADRLPPNPELDVMREVRPPQLVAPPPCSPGPAADEVRLRVLVDEDGKVMDLTPLGGRPAQVEAAEKEVESWKFRPARWGNLMVPWYVDVAVPMNGSADPPPPPKSLEPR